MELQELANQVVVGNAPRAIELIEKMLSQGVSPERIMQAGLLPGIKEVIFSLRRSNLFLPEVMISFGVMRACFRELEKEIRNFKDQQKIILGTIKGDIHTLGKDLTKMIFEVEGLQVVDRGADVSSKNFIEGLEQFDARMVGISVMMTTCLGEVKKAVGEIKDYSSRNNWKGVTILAGGLALNSYLAKVFGIDIYAEDGMMAIQELRSRKIISFD